MIRFHWLHNLLGMPQSRKDRRRLAARKRKPVRLMLESLEERLTPSGGNATVTQTAGGYTALTGLVAGDTAANTNYVIEITQGFQFTSGGQVTISKLGAGSTLTIEGQNGANQTLTGNGNRLFTVDEGQTVTFENLTLTGGKVTNTVHGATGGGAIFDQGGTVTLSKAVVERNKVTGGTASGGGIYVSGGLVAGSSATLTIKGGSTIKSNAATATGGNTTNFGTMFSNGASGGGLYVNVSVGAITLTISDSTISNNSAKGAQGANGATAGAAGGSGGSANGGGMDVVGSAWNATLMGDTFSGNSVIGGAGGIGAAGSNASSPNTSGGNGGSGGMGGEVEGGAAVFNGDGDCNLTILNDPAAPTTHPSLVIDNSAQAGAGGNGGAGGTSTGTANNSTGGQSGFAGEVVGGALDVAITPSFTETSGTATIVIGNTTIYGNKATGGAGGTGGAAGTGGSGNAGDHGHNNSGGFVEGGGLAVSYEDSSTFNIAFTVFNSTVASNIATGGAGVGGAGSSLGAGIFISPTSTNASSSLALYNNTITQNSNRGEVGLGAGVEVLFTSSPSPVQSSVPSLYNNLIQSNMSSSSEDDLAAGGTTLSNATNNFISTTSVNAVSTSTNKVGNNTPQLAGVVGVNAQGNPTGGPVYYPLLTGVVSIGAGTTGNNVLSTIATLEGTTQANATDEIGGPRLTNGKIDPGAVQVVSNAPPPAPSPSPSPSPGPAPSPSPSPPGPPPLNSPPLLAFLTQLLGCIETLNADGSATLADNFFGIPLITATFDAQGHLLSVTLFGINVTVLFE